MSPGVARGVEKAERKGWKGDSSRNSVSRLDTLMLPPVRGHLPRGANVWQLKSTPGAPTLFRPQQGGVVIRPGIATPAREGAPRSEEKFLVAAGRGTVLASAPVEADFHFFSSSSSEQLSGIIRGSAHKRREGTEIGFHGGG